MLQSASNWIWGSEETKNTDSKEENKNNIKTEEETDEKNKNKDKNENKDNDTQTVEKLVELKKTLQSILMTSSITDLFRLIDYKQSIHRLLGYTFNISKKNELTKEEMNGIMDLFEYIYKSNDSSLTNTKLITFDRMKLAEIILSYFASTSATNPDSKGCWDRWFDYRMKTDYDLNVKTKGVKQFYETKTLEIGYGNKGRIIWFVQTEFYDGYIADEIQRKAVILQLMSFLWDIENNDFNLHSLRNGICAYLDLSHWSVNMASWSTIIAIKEAMVAFPYSLKDIYIINPPMFVYLVKSVASQFFTAHSLDKFVFLDDQNEWFTKHSSKDKTPIVQNGTSKITAIQWVSDKGYLS